MKLQVQDNYGLTLSLKGEIEEYTYNQVKDCLFTLNGKEGYIRYTGERQVYGHGYSLPQYDYKFITKDFELLSLNHLDIVINLEPNKITEIPLLVYPEYVGAGNILEVNGEEGMFSYEIQRKEQYEK